MGGQKYEISRAGAAWLKELEGGFHSATYYVFGVPHNGYGFNLNYHVLPQPISREFADQYFDQLMADIGERIYTKFGSGLSQCKVDALTSFVYNTGFVPNALANIHHNGGNFNAVFETLAATVNGEPEPSLMARRRKEVQYIESCERMKRIHTAVFFSLILFAYVKYR